MVESKQWSPEELPAVADDANSFLLASGGVWYPEWDIVRDGEQTFQSLDEYAKSKQ